MVSTQRQAQAIEKEEDEKEEELEVAHVPLELAKGEESCAPVSQHLEKVS